MKKFCKIKFGALIWFTVLLQRSIATPTNDTTGCFKIDKKGTRFQFFCANAQELFNETCANSTISQAVQQLNASAVMELKISGCGANGYELAAKELENVNDLDISYLNYGSNSIKILHWHLDIPSNERIIKLNMSHNGFDYEPHFTFLTELVELYLQHNEIRFVNGMAFENLKKLEILDLSNNAIYAFFSTLPANLKAVHLEQNPITQHIPCAMHGSDFEWLPIRNVYVSWQSLEYFDIMCLKYSIQPVFDSQEFITFANGTVELHCNNRNFENVEEFRMRTDQIENFSKFIATVAPTLDSLETLRVRGSKQISEIDFNDIKVIPRLKRIFMDECNLKRAKNPSVLRIFNLTEFNAVGSRIENAREFIQHFYSSLEWLALSGNRLGEVTVDTFAKLMNLKDLRLSGTNMNITGSSPFDQLKRLERLDISHNDLSSAKLPILSTKLENLKVFDATDCRIQNASEIFSLFGPTIAEIKLSGNNIGKLDANTFKNMTELTELYLSNTNLSIEDAILFKPLEKLWNLDVSYNDLSNADFTILSTMLQGLREFHAVGCKIRSPIDVVRLLGNDLKVLDLSDNFIGKVDFTIFFKDFLEKLILRNTSLQIQNTKPMIRPRRMFHLDISRNNFSGFNFTVSSMILSTLYVFHAAGCQIRNVDEILDHIALDMATFNLSDNPIEQINFNKFAEIDRLYEIDLSNTQLLSFDSAAFERIRRLQIINISFNHLHHLNISSKLSYLETLDVRGNQLSEIHNLNPRHLPKLRRLGVSGNRFDRKYLEQLKDEWEELEFIDDEWNQNNTLHVTPLVTIAILVMTIFAIMTIAYLLSSFYRNPNHNHRILIHIRSLRQRLSSVINYFRSKTSDDFPYHLQNSSDTTI